jgi:shikimate dehydrogenase
MEITSKTSLFLLIGHPVAWSITPQLYNRIFEEMLIDARYLSLDISPKHFAKVFPCILDSGLAGNIMPPFREKALSFIDIPNEEAMMTGGCNVFWHEDGMSHGDNTSLYGFLEGLPDDFRKQIGGSAAIILGAGSIARSITVGLILEGIAKLMIVNRNEKKAGELAAFLRDVSPIREIYHTGYDTFQDFRYDGFNFLINATSVGWRDGEAPPIDPGTIADLEFYYDAIYGRKTALMKKCEAIGVKVVGGLEMLIQQKTLSLEKWFDIKNPVDIIRESTRMTLERNGSA